MSVWVSVMSLLSSVSHGFIFKMGSKKCQGLHIIGEDYFFSTAELFLTCLHIFTLVMWPCFVTWQESNMSTRTKRNKLATSSGKSWVVEPSKIPGLWHNKIFPLYIETSHVKTPVSCIFNRKSNFKIVTLFLLTLTWHSFKVIRI